MIQDLSADDENDRGVRPEKAGVAAVEQLPPEQPQLRNPADEGKVAAA